MGAEPGGGIYGCGGNCGNAGYPDGTLATKLGGGDLCAFSIASAVKPVKQESKNNVKGKVNFLR